MAITVPDVPDQPVNAPRIQATASLETFGGGAGLEQEGQEIQKLAATGADLAATAKANADQVAYQNAAAKLGQHATNLLYNPQTGIISSRGINAIPSHDAGWQNFRKTANEISGELKDDSQKAAFNHYALNLGQEFNRTAMSNVSQQIQKHDDETTEAFLKNTTDFAAMSYGDPLTRERSLKDLDNAVQAYAYRKGMDSDQFQALKAETNSKFHKQILDRMIDDSSLNPETAMLAEQYYAKVKDDIRPEYQEKIEKALGEGSVRAASMKETGRILGDNPDSEADALEAANKIKNEAVKDSVRKSVSARFTQDRTAKKNDQDNLFMELNTMVNQKGLSDPYDRKMAVPPSKWNELSPAQQKAIEKGGGVEESSISRWADFDQKVRDGSISKMPKAELFSNYIPYFSPSDQKQAVDAWAKGQNPHGPQFKGIQNVAQSIDNKLVTSGLIPANKRGEKDKLLLKTTTEAVNRDIVDFVTANNRPPKPEERQKIEDTQVIRQMNEKSSGAFRAISNFVTGNKIIPFEEIPEPIKLRIIDLAKQQGQPASRKDVEDAYAAFLKSKKPSK